MEVDADVDVEMGGAETPYGVGADARLESRVASISAEFRAAFADAGVDEDGEEIDQLEDDEDGGGEPAREGGGSASAGEEGIVAAASAPGVQEGDGGGGIGFGIWDEEDDSDAFPVPLRARKGK